MGCCQTDDGRYDYKSNRASDLLAGPIFICVPSMIDSLEVQVLFTT